MPKTKKKLPLVVIFGRTNVGKSTLFNTLVEKHQAIVSDIAGTTRDSNVNIVRWGGFAFELIDTGGIINPNEETLFDKRKPISTENPPRLAGLGTPPKRGSGKEIKTEEEINIKVQKQAVQYLKLADLVLFVVDNKTGILPADRQMINVLRKNLTGEIEKKIMLVANKVDSQAQQADAAEFNKLGLGEPFMISAVTGSGTGDLLDLIAKFLKKKKLSVKEKTEEEEKISVCMLGKPNVGKSSLLNSLLGYEKVIVSPIPHTTREPQNTELEYLGKKIILIDTAGISQHAHQAEGLEKYGVEKSLATLRRSDIVLLVLDINEILTHQDAKLVEEIVEAGKSLIIIANKWDLVKERNTKKYTAEIRDHFPFANWAPIQFASAKTGEKVQKIFDLILELEAARKIQLSNSQLAHFLSKIVKIHRPAKGKGTRPPHIYEFKQEGIDPPVFEVRIGPDDNLHFSYTRFIINQLREKYGFNGVPIKIFVSNKPKVHGQMGLPGRKRAIPGRPPAVPRRFRAARRK
ncbi:MAG: ribosome biogenesis GTPase Der [Patescibacteria group bacterium]|nr:ribosome biogenesis GTPase Der [Patescibacteria group bacterium]